MILHLDAIILTLGKITALKGTEESNWAVEFLDSDGCTPEALVTLAMCADMAAACLDLTRYCDDENMDIAELNYEVSTFVHSLQALCVVNM